MEKFVLKELKSLTLELKNNDNLFIYKLPINNISQMQILEFIVDNNDKDINQRDLEMALHLKKPTISGILDTMERNGVIVRLSDKEDARKKIIKLSKEANDKHIHIMERFQEFNEYLVNNIPKDKLDVFYEVLDLIRNNLKEGK